MTATEFWRQRFGEDPQTDSERLAVAMMSNYSGHCSADVAQQRELLIAYEKKVGSMDNLGVEESIDRYLKDLSNETT